MALTRAQHRRSIRRLTRWGIVAPASVLLIGAASTSHISPQPAISATLVIGAAIVVALRLTPAVAVLTSLASAIAAGLAAAILFSATPGETALAVVTTVTTTCLAIEILRRLRPSDAPPGATLNDLDARSPAEPVLLELARKAFDTFDKADIELIFEKLLEALDCDTITVWRNSEDGGLTGTLHCWAGEAPPENDTIVWSRSPMVAGLFSTNRPHIFRDVADVATPDRAGYRRAGITAAIEIPVSVDGRWAGHVRMGNRLGSRTWEPDEIDAVQAVSEMVSSAWTRHAAVQRTGAVIAQRDRSLAVQRAISESARLLFESDEDRLNPVLQLLLASMNGRVAHYLAVRHHEEYGTGLVPVGSAVAAGAVVPAHLHSGNLLSIPQHYAPLLEGQPVIVSDLEDLEQHTRAWYSAALPDTRAEVSFPVANGGTVVGVIGVMTNTVRDWDASEIRTVATIAQMLGVARARAEARRGLEEIVKAKDSFIASVSHQLRTPMAVVMGLSSELNARWSDFTREEVFEFIDLIARESREVSNIIEDLLVAARASAESITVLPEVIRLDEVVGETVAAMSAEVTFRLASLELSPVSTFADPLRIRQIVRNLVANGHRHGGTKIFVRVAEVDGSAVVEVSDDGAGIPPERRDRIFHAYEAGESDGRTATIGLGLTVSRQLARLMGGDVTYRQEPMPTFRLGLPVGASVETPADLRVVAR